VGDCHFIEFLENLFSLLAGNQRQARYFAPDLLDFVVVELAQKFGARLLAETDQQNRDLT